MPDDEKKADEPPFRTAAEVYGVTRDQPDPTPGLSQSPGLRTIENSPVPNTDRSHVLGPQQSAVDPVLAGLDLAHNPMTRAEARVITRADGAMVVPPPDTESDAMVGPSGFSAPAAPTAAADAAKVTPTADMAISQPRQDAPAADPA